MITVPLTTIGVLSYRQYMTQVEKDANNYTGQIANQILNSIDRYYKEMDRLTTAPYYDQSVMHILRSRLTESSRDFVPLEEINRMSLLISSLAAERPEIQNILIFAMDGVLFTNTDDSVNKSWSQEATSWMESVIAADGAIVAIPPHSARYYKSGEQRVISLARVIRDPQNHQHLGIVKIDLTQGGFASIFGLKDMKPDTVIHVASSQGAMLYSSLEMQDPMLGKSEGGPFFLTAEEYSPVSGIVVKALVPEEDLKKNARALIRYSLFVSAAALLCAFLLSGFLAARLTRPIHHLAATMRKIQRGEFKERAKVTSRDEIGWLTEGFNTMVSELDRLVHQVYESELREKEAQLSALQSQMNPHFIYNTLESINVKALEWGNTELSEAVVSLGRLLRYTVDRHERFVHLEDELQFAEAYLQIQSFRLGDKLSMQIESDLSLGSCLMPKLILQPLVENAIEHGMKDGPFPIHIRIRACCEEEDLLIYVEDNGKGMTPAQMLQVERSWREPDQRRGTIGSFGVRKKGFALRNVSERLRLLYGPGYGISFDNRPKQGASFCIRIPLQWGNEE
ncbi:cache domain-containing sensor histidine kinase [Paenibacillus silviterrae]|uniref:cache domain-containing sensor histidine kinase n=1 Tax=Paenibacillus silviterrae TaxID=3242194 RepID=UPI002542A1B0|nr:sensor histidine kinase [Paenibacillus chinjuensis]